MRAPIGLLLVGFAAIALGCDKPADPTVAAAPVATTTASAQAKAQPSRIVSVGGTVTEIVFALGLGSEVVAVDTSSIHPAEATKLPKVGYQRALSSEGVASQRPTQLLMTAEAGPPAVVAQLKEFGVPVTMIAADASVDGTKAKIRAVAKAVGREAKGEELVKSVEADLAKAQAITAKVTERPKVLFVYARGAGTLMVGGEKTPAEVMLGLAAADNAAKGFEGFKPLTAEAVVGASPDVILVPTHGLESLGGIDGMLKQPGVALTPAGKARRIVAVDDLLLLGFGPRLGEAVVTLTRALHPTLAEASP